MKVVPPKARLGLNEKPEMGEGVRVRVAVRVLVPSVADRDSVSVADTAEVVIEKVADREPAGMVTVDG